MFIYVKFAIFAFSSLSYVNCQDPCTTAGVPGKCIIVTKCPTAIEDLKRKKYPQICSFSGVDPIVCCEEEKTTLVTQRPETITHTQQYAPEANQTCVPLLPGLTAAKMGRKAWDKCLEYQERYVYPCERNILGEHTRAMKCTHNTDEMLTEGDYAQYGEYPHMAMLGFGTKADTATWQCGGAIISERFILTAAHCTNDRTLGPVSFIRIRVLKRSDRLEPDQLYGVKSIVTHPDFKPPIRYHDIALLESDREFKLGTFGVPACLHIGDDVNDDVATATGWGLPSIREPVTDTLKKIKLTKSKLAECSQTYPEGMRNMIKGVNSTTQLCYGGSRGWDTCQGDSGGPLQIRSAKFHCMYVIIGITSYGRGCGLADVPGIYSRVAAYTEWIESVVWRD